MKFSISLCPSTFSNWNFILRKSSLFSSHSLVNILININVSMDLGYLFYSECYNPVLSLFIWRLTLFQLRPLGVPLVWLFRSINKPYHFLSTPLFSGTTRCSWLILYFPCPSSVVAMWRLNGSICGSPSHRFSLEFRSSLFRNQRITRRLSDLSYGTWNLSRWY